MTKTKTNKGWAENLPSAMDQAEEILGPLDVYQFGAKVTTTIVGTHKTVTFETFANGWKWSVK